RIDVQGGGGGTAREVPLRRVGGEEAVVPDRRAGQGEDRRAVDQGRGLRGAAVHAQGDAARRSAVGRGDRHDGTAVGVVRHRGGADRRRGRGRGDGLAGGARAGGAVAVAAVGCGDDVTGHAQGRGGELGAAAAEGPAPQVDTRRDIHE